MANFQSSVTRNLQCPICLSLLKDPKQLVCTHTFCKPCLQGLLVSKPASMSISCPVCRSTTDVANDDVSNLPTNVPLKAIVSDVEAIGQQCGACDEGSTAIQYCCDCDQMLCNDCRVIHDKWKPNVNHKVVSTARIEDVSDLVGKNCTTPIKEDPVAIREILSDELKTALKAKTPLESSASKVTISAEKLKYEPENSKGKVGLLGKVNYSTWKQKADIALSTVNTMHCMATAPDGRMAVGCWNGEHGIEIYSGDGQLQQTVLKGECVYAMGFLSDGRCVVRDANTNNTVSVYTPGWEKLDVRFKTLSIDEGGYGHLTVDSDDHIYVSYRNAKKILVFTSTGGWPVREIQCDGYIPCQIFAMKSRKMLVVKGLNNSSRVIDSRSGCEHHILIKDTTVYIYPGLREDDTILIATVNKDRDRVTIEHYTSELKHVSTVITDHVIEKTKSCWFYLQEFSSGNIAFCTTNRLYIFYKQD